MHGRSDMISMYMRHLLVQAEPDVIRGRVSAVNTVFIGASNELGEFESGVTARGGALPRRRGRRHGNPRGRGSGRALPDAWRDLPTSRAVERDVGDRRRRPRGKRLELRTTDPVAFEIGPIQVHWYGIIRRAVLGAGGGHHESRGGGSGPDVGWAMLLPVLVAAVIGARIYHVIHQWDFYVEIRC